MKYFLIFLCASVSTYSFSQNNFIDSLKHRLNSPDPYDVQEAYFDLSWEYSFIDIDSAEFFCKKALNLCQERKDSISIFKMKSMMASIYDIKGKIEDAVSLYLEAATYYDRKKDIAQLSKTYNNLGVLFFNIENYEQAHFYFEQSKVLDFELGDSLGMVGSIVNLASIKNQQNKYDEGLDLLLEGKAIAQAMGGDYWIFDGIFEGIGNNYLYQKKYDSALVYMESLVEKHRQSKDAHSAITVLISLSIVNLELNNEEEAIRNINEAEMWADQFKTLVNQKELFESAANIYSKFGDFEKAFEYQKKYISVSDSLSQRERVEVINDLERKYQSEQKEKEIAILSVNNQRSINQRNMFIFIALLFILGAIFLYSRWKSKSKSAAIIEKSLNEKETLLKEIHHRVKNNLQVVSSLLSLQSRFIQDKGALDAVNEGQTRVESMALIHQKLYQDNNLSGVNALEYIQDLVDVLSNSYSTGNQIEVHYDIDELNIDVDTIIPIGLILNELISNSFKHAFPEGKDGNLYISFHEKGQMLYLVVSDDGIGSVKKSKESESFGLILIESLAQKLKANVESTFENGAKTSLQIAKYKLV